MTFSRRKVIGSRISALTSQSRLRSKFSLQRTPALTDLLLLSPGNKTNRGSGGVFLSHPVAIMRSKTTGENEHLLEDLMA